ncbi:MAG TPA: S1C family serine protease [Burkholderiales bacterium]|nr:S1C family serine protease [Burkholderiales bacterium]
MNPWIGRTLKLATLLSLAGAVVVSQPLYAQESDAPAAPAQRGKPAPSVDALSVVRVRTQASANARSGQSLGRNREGTGVVIDSSGLVLTIGYLITEAEKIELSTADGKVYPATVIGFDNATGLGLLKSLVPVPIRPIDMGLSSETKERDMVLIVGFDGVAPAYVVSKRQFVGYWEYLLDEAIYTAPATVNWQGAALVSREGKLLGIGSLAVGNAIGASANVPGNMFVPIDVLKPVIGDFIANGRSTVQPRPWLGVTSQEVGGNLLVVRVSPEGPAEEAGLKAGDIIVGIAGEGLKGQADFYTRLWKSGNAGVEVMLDVLRGNRLENMKVKSIDRNNYFRAKATY